MRKVFAILLSAGISVSASAQTVQTSWPGFEHGIPYCVWNYLSTPNDGNRFSLVDDDTRKILSPALLMIIQGKGPRD
ncbi:MAG: hypothetical protein IJV01_03880 [Bacteroidales bacterium]|nr:hypothetical protein [Bacteroidales bacterium]